jgi:predicted MarR family transcription regulator
MATKPPSRAAAQRAQGIVSSSHLVSPRSVEASEFEFGMIVAWNAFSRWMVRCMQAAGVPDLTVTDVLVLHHVNHRARHKKLADICFVLNYEDTHVVAYALKKLVAAGLLCTDKQGKDVFYLPTEAGEAAVQRYREVREACLVDNIDPRWQFWIDRGGTFTDIVARGPTAGSSRTSCCRKTPSSTRTRRWPASATCWG